jgi:hypothetical protein
MVAQRQCACDPACICRIAGNCITLSGDVMPGLTEGLTKLGESVAQLAGSESAEVMVSSASIELPRQKTEETTLSGVPSPKDRAQHCESNECQIRGLCTRVSAACTSKLMLARAELLTRRPTRCDGEHLAPDCADDDGCWRAKKRARDEDAVSPHDVEVLQADPNQKCACGAHTNEGQHELTPYCTSEMDRAAAAILAEPHVERVYETVLLPPKNEIEIVPPERLRAELAAWQDELSDEEDPP